MSAFTEAWLAEYQARHARPGQAVRAAPPSPAKPISIHLELPLPPSVNALYANVPGKGRVKTKTYREWIRAASNRVFGTSIPERIDGSFTAEIDIFQRTLGSDLDNRIKACLDFCKRIGAIKDDRYLVSLKVELFVGEPRVLLHLQSRT